MLFSVIVPIYNVEEYLYECIDSVLSQTFKDFKLILVDDGSPDKCAAICDAYAEKDKRVVVIHKPNGGLVSARQAGMKKASGEYIVNVDGDDFISSDMLSEAYYIIQKCNPDIVGFSLNRCSPDGTDIQHDYAQEGLYTKEQMKKSAVSVCFAFGGHAAFVLFPLRKGYSGINFEALSDGSQQGYFTW